MGSCAERGALGSPPRPGIHRGTELTSTSRWAGSACACPGWGYVASTESSEGRDVREPFLALPSPPCTEHCCCTLHFPCTVYGYQHCRGPGALPPAVPWQSRPLWDSCHLAGRAMDVESRFPGGLCCCSPGPVLGFQCCSPHSPVLLSRKHCSAPQNALHLPKI